MVPPPSGAMQTCGTARCGSSVATVPGTATATNIPAAGPAPLRPSAVINAHSETNAQRVQSVRERLKLPPAGTSKQGTELTTDTLLHHEHGGGLPGEQKIMVCWQVRTTKTPRQINSDLGSSSKKWAVSMYMTDIKSAIVSAINVEWLRNNQIAIEDDEVSIRWFNNRVLDANTSTMTLGDFYAYYSTPSNAPMYLQNVPPMWKHYLKQKSSPFICLEMYLDFTTMQKRIDNLENNTSDSEFDCDRMLRSAATSAAQKNARKRSRTESTASTSSSKQPTTKQPRANGGVPVSQFGLSHRVGRSEVHKQSEITFKKVLCITTVTTGQCKLVDSGDIYYGYILDKPFSSGAMKHAYDLHLSDGEQYVAKRFYQLEPDAGEDTASPEDNRVEIEAEVVRLSQGKWFLDAFYRFCRGRKDVSIDLNIEFTDAFLAVEVKQPSKASGLASIPEGQEEGLTWLVERKRPTTVIKFSGTLVHHTHRTDLRSATISAFTHFVYGFSNQSLVFADLQGTPSRVKGKDGLILFDVMTHTNSGDSGVGDFGLEGIKTFLSGHKCSTICGTLGIQGEYPLSLPSDDAGDGLSTKDGEEDEDDFPLQIHE
ncbi:kinase-like domain-containing protein [Mycena filopes]|nr:kinase-like domain-containing protein [Mycena filopes]